MNIRTLTLSILIFFGFICSQNAQNRASLPKDGLSARYVLMGYQAPYTGDILGLRDYGNGFEIGYNYLLSENFSLYVPLRFGVSRFYQEENHSRMVGLDANIRYYFKENIDLWNPYVTTGLGFMTEGDAGVHASLPIGFGLGLKLNELTQLNLDASYRIGTINDRSSIQIGIGFTTYIGEIPEEKVDTVAMPVKKDADNDGVVDELDLCPNEKGFAEFSGCPDTDGDEIPDYKDECPQTPGPKKFNGCPDSDDDGVSDNKDECPNEPGLIANKGCPAIDSDNDGVPDKDDRCPELYGAITKEGCPDSDGDGIIDPDDLCPQSKGPKSNYGCPEIQEEDQSTLEVAMEAVQFETAKATLKPKSFKILDDIVDILRSYPDYDLRITGHTDNVGSSQSNLQLSENRARACYEYIASRGISTSRLSYVGYGESQPRATNETAEGRSMNRRVEFDLYIRKK